MANFELNALVVGLANAARRAEKDAAEVTEKHITKVSETMRTLVPVESGATRDSIDDEVTIQEGRVVGESGPSTYYAHFIEYGTSRTGPRAFAGPSLDRHSGDYEQEIGDVGTSWF